MSEKFVKILSVLYLIILVIFIITEVRINNQLNDIDEELKSIHEELVTLNVSEQEINDRLSSYELYLDSQIQELSVLLSQTEDLVKEIQDIIGDK